MLISGNITEESEQGLIDLPEHSQSTHKQIQTPLSDLCDIFLKDQLWIKNESQPVS